MSKLKAIIVDLDSTLANNSHRVHFVSGENKDWDSFHAGIKDDVPNDWCLDLVWKYWETGTKVFFVTGRHEEYREVTEDFLLNKCDFENDVECSVPMYELLMRSNEDRREDYIIKQEIFEEHIKDKYDVLFAIDDRKQVVDMWRRNGIVCLQCADGNF